MTSGPLVSLVRHSEYRRESLLDAVAHVLHPLGGMAAFVNPGDQVLLKPNLLFGRHQDKAINTHPEMVRAVATLARQAGAGRICIGDSPGYGSARAAARGCGILAVADELDLELVEFTPVENIDHSRSFPRLELAEQLLNADVVINLPKLKTHGQMLMTMAVKNMFGAVPGARKFQWHYRAGRDRELFARVVNDIAAAVRPQLSILDGVVGMDETGPSSGRARPVGVVAASADPWAVDAVMMDMVGIDRERLPVLAAAAKFGPYEWQELRVVGEKPESLRPDDWRLPNSRTLQMHGGFIENRLPRLAKFLRSHISPIPAANADCTACGHCVAICPARAMRLESGRLLIDADACIRCYCCHELCQHEGMDMRSDGVVARLLGFAGGVRPGKSDRKGAGSHSCPGMKQ
ncbi:MAG: DUF362 domain-containing protein [Planctomycetes bacterium]|nr:DUF362 domain-containing protein [Planctomycetota bacterium]